MATIQVREVPDEVAAVIAEKASAEHKSVSAYLRDLMAADYGGNCNGGRSSSGTRSWHKRSSCWV